MLTLYHHPISTGSRYVRLICAEYGQTVELIEERSWDRRAEFLLMNAAGTVPVLVDNGREPICGATVIGEYLDEIAGAMMRDRRLMPENPAARAEIRRLIEWYMVKFENEVIRHLVGERIQKQLMRTSGDGSPDSGVIRAGRANLRNHMKYTGWLTASRDWLGGSQMTQADLAAAAAISVLDYMGEIDWPAEPAARDWYARIKSRPSFRPLLGEKFSGMPAASHYADLDF